MSRLCHRDCSRQGAKQKTDFFVRAQELCRKWHAAHFRRSADRLVAPEKCSAQRGIWAGHYHNETLRRLCPCGAIITRREIYQKTFSRMDRCVVHSTTFGRNNLAMACGLAALEVIDSENLIDNCARMGRLLMEKIDNLRAKHSFIKEVAAKGSVRTNFLSRRVET
jgi:hypothetical protein